jgi:hypothetical protein
MRLKIATCLLLLLALTGCGPAVDTPLSTSIPTVSSRFSVTRVGVFEDALAYGGSRGIYVVFDSQTNREYVGVSGVGISELGSHPVGKTIVSDER